jgi:hypothetical protein
MLNKSIKDISFQDINDFCALKVEENSWLDYKQKFGKHDKENANVAKILSSMANAHGGWVFVGVEEDRSRPDSPGRPGNLLGVPAVDVPADRIAKIGLGSVYPPIVPELKVVDVPGTDKVIVAVRVHESDATPHRTNEGKVWIRTNDVSQLLDDGKEAIEEIEFLLRRREKATALREAIIARSEQRCGMNPSSPYLIVYACPRYPSAPILNYQQLAKWDFGKNVAWSGHQTLQTVHEGVMDVFSRKSQWADGRTTCFDLSVFGSLYYRTHAIMDRPSEYMLDRSMVSSLFCSVLHAANTMFEAANFDGLIEVGLGLHNPGGKMSFSGGRFGRRDSLPDASFMITRATYRHLMLSQEFCESIYREFLWSGAYGVDAIDSETPQKIIETSLSGLSHL